MLGRMRSGSFQTTSQCPEGRKNMAVREETRMSWDHPLSSRANGSKWIYLGYLVPVSHRFNVINQDYSQPS